MASDHDAADEPMRRLHVEIDRDVFPSELQLQPDATGALDAVTGRDAGAGLDLRDAERRLREALAGRRAAEATVDRLMRLQMLTAALSRVSRLADAAATAVAHAPVALGTTVAALYLRSADGSALERASHAGLPEALFPRAQPIDGTSLSAVAARTGEPQWIETNEATLGHPPEIVKAIEHGLRAGAFLPLVGVDGGILGVLGLGFGGTDRLLESERSFALMVAELCARAVDRALVQARADRAAQFLAQLEEVTDAFSRSLTPADVASVVVTRGRSLLGAIRGSVWLVAEEGAALDLLVTDPATDELAAAPRRVALARALPITDALRSGAALFFETRAAVLAAYPEIMLLTSTDTNAVGIVPFGIDGQMIGVVAFVFDAPRRFDGDERAFIVEISRKCALAFERARLYEASVRARFDAEVANRAKDDFLSTVSHELRTPLTAVLGWASILRARVNEPAMVERGLAIIERNARAQAQLIEDILDVSRMATGKLRLEVALVDAAALVQAAIDLVLPTAEGRGVAIAVTVDPAVGCFAADPARLQQIAGNLLSNAIKFTPRGGRVAVQLDRLDGRVRLRITDTGKGIEADLLPHVFDQFRQGESHSTRMYGGLGLGLAIVKHLVELHEGTITADSAGPGQGATLTVTLPLAPKAAELRGGLASDPPTPSLQRLDGVRVLVVDDNADTREMLATVLEEQGAITAVAGTAAEALASVLLARPQVLVSDVGMPDEDGYSLLRKVRALGPVPAIALTAYTGPQDARMAELAGFDRHLAKPITPARLVDAIARLVVPLRVG